MTHHAPLTDEATECVVAVGVHPPPYWRDRVEKDFIVCSRHRQQYDESDLGPFDWEEL